MKTNNETKRQNEKSGGVKRGLKKVAATGISFAAVTALAVGIIGASSSSGISVDTQQEAKEITTSIKSSVRRAALQLIADDDAKSERGEGSRFARRGFAKRHDSSERKSGGKSLSKLFSTMTDTESAIGQCYSAAANSALGIDATSQDLEVTSVRNREGATVTITDGSTTVVMTDALRESFGTAVKSCFTENEEAIKAEFMAKRAERRALHDADDDDVATETGDGETGDGEDGDIEGIDDTAAEDGDIDGDTDEIDEIDDIEGIDDGEDDDVEGTI